MSLVMTSGMKLLPMKRGRFWKSERLRKSDAEFLISIGKIDEAEEYLLARAGQLDGNNYGSLLSVAEAMESANRHLVTILIYR
jgi:hypothetical protein